MIKLILYSLHFSEAHLTELSRLVGKAARETSIALIENAADVIPNSTEWLGEIRNSLTTKGFQVEPLDLREWLGQADGLQEQLKDKDVVWLGGGNTYYLRWVLKASGADKMIQELVKQGKVYAGWSAGAIVAGPTLQYFDIMGDDPKDAVELVQEGMHLTECVIVPHMDHPEFMDNAQITHQQLQKEGFHTIPLKDSQGLIIEGKKRQIM